MTLSLFRASELLAVLLLLPALAVAQTSGPNSGGSGGGGGQQSTTWSTPQNTTGTDTVSFSGANGANQIWTITQNEAFTLSDSRTASTTSRLRDQLMVCQNSTGNFTISFSGSITWCNGMTSPSYPLTASGSGPNCQIYQFDWNGTDLVCVSNGPTFAGP